MNDPRDELVERVAQLYEDKWGITDHWLARAAIGMALEEAAKIAEAKADEWATAWRNRFKTDSHMEGKSAGADEIASAIRAMITKENTLPMPRLDLPMASRAKPVSKDLKEETNEG